MMELDEGCSCDESEISTESYKSCLPECLQKACVFLVSKDARHGKNGNANTVNSIITDSMIVGVQILILFTQDYIGRHQIPVC